MTGKYERSLPDYSSHIERFTGERSMVQPLVKRP
jgi:hypothetical protein